MKRMEFKTLDQSQTTHALDEQALRALVGGSGEYPPQPPPG